jgi:shikimate dehydrogenase
MKNKKFALLGFPLAQSMSKEFFTDFFLKNNIDAEYQSIELENINDFSKIIAEKKFAGFNVTIPHKEKIIPFLDFLDETAQKVGAVNVISVKNDKLIGYNTDIYGFDKAIEPFLIPTRKNALILGTGGAAKAVKYALERRKINSKYVSRTKSENNFVYAELNRQIIENNQIIINATSVGMLPCLDKFPNIPYEFLSENHILFDLICKPPKTLFLQKGEANGAEISNGLQMFYYQAIESYEIWNK